LGYGEAGTKIISKLLKQNNFNINYEESKGEKVMAIYGFVLIN
jgi:hypothetical protein